MDTGYVEGKIVNTNKNGEVWLDLIGDRTLWLKCTYNEKQKKPISQVDFFYFHQNSIEEDAEGKFPIPIQQINNDLSKNGKKLQHEYDLVPYLQAQKYEDYCLVLTFKRQRDLVKENAISVIDIAIGQKNKKKIHGDITYVIPNQFQALKSLISFGEPNKNRIIIVKQRKSFLMQQFAPQIIDKYPHKNHGYYEFNNDVALMCFPQGIRFHIQDQSPQAFSFVLTNEKQESIYCTTLVFTEIAQTDILKQIEQMYKISSQGNQLYQEKAICLVSHYDYFFEQKELLKYIYRFHLAKNSIRLEQVISKILGKLQFKENLQNILHKNQCVSLDLGNCVLNFRQNVYYQHFDEESIKVLMMVFDTDKIISLVQCILLEKQIYLISKQKSLITLVSSALLSLTYPMQWLYPWIPILSDAMKQGQQAPVPFIIGIDQNDPDHQQGLQSDTISAYIDTNDLLNIESIPKLPEKIYKTLYKKLQKYDRMRNEQRHYINEFIEKSDECFYKVYLDGFQFDLNYDSYVVKDAFFEFMFIMTVKVTMDNFKCVTIYWM
ncbi:hypothetical protein PPERSA_10686 [Pseudocohnilembus persalinus]|uniref:UDENN domain-containing protein n=1 Tax=Pseudocohnilembus persalinus TaxID=266149 RepID=A0A0V0QDB5_PSEPJ|nr:hypothetical protein PPERSA_10686 [Pseudocohnilembus persalinus]|eukprot:KRX00187.1 hypothetical protein PPERSA_10686 [Pseudocohnilembus persalinus]